MCLCMHVVCVFGHVSVFVCTCVLTFRILYPFRNRSSPYVIFHVINMCSSFFTMQLHSKIADKKCGPILLSTVLVSCNSQLTDRKCPCIMLSNHESQEPKLGRKHWHTHTSACACKTIKNMENYFNWQTVPLHNATSLWIKEPKQLIFTHVRMSMTTENKEN